MDQNTPKLPFPLQLKTKDLGHNKFACVKCFPNAKEIAKLSDELWLIEWNAKYYLIDDSCVDTADAFFGTLFQFDGKPIPYEDSSSWETEMRITEERLNMPADDGYKLVKGLMEWGYDPKGEINLEFFLLNWAGIQIHAWEHANNEKPNSPKS